MMLYCLLFLILRQIEASAFMWLLWICGLFIHLFSD